MSTTTVTQAVEKRDTGAAELVRHSRPWFATVVPSHIDASAFVALAVAYLRRNPKLAEAADRNPQSFMAALSECARLGLVPGDTYHCVPFEDRRNSTVEITGIVDYTGEIELIYRAGAVASVKAEIVYSRDVFRFTTDMDRPEHAPNWFGDRGELIGAYAYAVMKDGATSKVVIYSKAEIDRVKAVSKTSSRDDSPWKLWYDRMALKTVLHRLAHFVPTSAEYRREQLRAAAEISHQVNSASVPPPMVVTEPQDIADAEIVDEPTDAPPAKPRGRGRKAGNGGGDIAGAIVQHFERLGITERDERLVWTSQLARRDEIPTSTNDLTEEQKKDVLEALAHCRDIGQLHDLTKTGEVPEGSDA